MKWDNLPGKQTALLHSSRDPCSTSEFAFETDSNHLAQIENVHNSGFHSSKWRVWRLLSNFTVCSVFLTHTDRFFSESCRLWWRRRWRLVRDCPSGRGSSRVTCWGSICWHLCANLMQCNTLVIISVRFFPWTVVRLTISKALSMSFLPFRPILRVIFMQRGMSTLQKTVLPFWFPPFCLFGAFYEKR